MNQTPLSNQAKALMDAANALDDMVGAKYGMGTNCSLYASQSAIYLWVLLCELERVESESLDT